MGKKSKESVPVSQASLVRILILIHPLKTCYDHAPWNAYHTVGATGGSLWSESRN